jgi:type I site-specific restriction endonuclease
MSEGLSEADTCRKFVVPKLLAAGWDSDPHSIAEQRTITDGRIVPVGKGFIRKPPKRIDFLLRYTRDFPLAVVEAKAAYRTAGDGVQQAKQYAEMLGVQFAYATNGHEIIEIDYTTGLERVIDQYPTPLDLWARYRAAHGLSDDNTANRLLAQNRGAEQDCRDSGRRHRQPLQKRCCTEPRATASAMGIVRCAGADRAPLAVTVGRFYPPGYRPKCRRKT